MRISDWSSDVCSSDLANSIGYDRAFNSLSGALGLSYQLADGLKVSVSGSRSERAPSPEELLSDGPHAATQAYERGDPTFGKETSWGGEASIKFNRDGWKAGLTGYASWFDDFIYETETGEVEEIGRASCRERVCQSV